MAYSKVELDGSTIIDLTGDNVSRADVASGKSFHLCNGDKTTGSLVDDRATEIVIDWGEHQYVTPTTTGLNFKPPVDVILGSTVGVTLNNNVIATKGGLIDSPTVTTNPNILTGNTYFGVSGSMAKHLDDVTAESVMSDPQAADGQLYFIFPEDGYYCYPNALQASITDVKNAYNAENNNVIAAGNIKSGVNIMGVTGTYSPSEVRLQNKTLAAGSLNLSAGSQTVTPDTGYDGMSSLVITKPTTLIAGNIKSGITVAGVSGTYTSDANATANKIASGYSGYVNGSKVDGNLTAVAAKTITPSASTQTAVASECYTTGIVKVAPVPTETKSITANGTYTSTSGKWWKTVTVAIPTYDGTVS